MDPFEFDLKAVEREGKADPVILEKGIVASVLSKNGDLSADSFNFTTGPEGPPLPDYGIPSRGATEFAGEDGLGHEMPEDLPQGLVVYQEYDLMLWVTASKSELRSALLEHLLYDAPMSP